jgi:hypothetical protein
LFNQIQDFSDYSDEGRRYYWTPIANKRWIRKHICKWALHERLSPVERKTLADNTWAAAHRQHKKMQGESAATAGCHYPKAAV